MKRIKFGLIIYGILLFGMAKAQSVTETRHVKTTALQIYENYKVVMSDLYSKNDYTKDNFMALFDSKSVIYNDIIPSNNSTLLSPARYFENFKTNIKRIYPVFSDFRMGDPVSVDSKWQIKCYFTRRTRFRTQKDLNYPEWSFNYTMTVEMNKRYDDNKKVYENAKITSVEVDNPLKGFFIIENKENTPLVTKSGETLKDWDTEYQSRIFPEDKWKIKDIQVFEPDKDIFGDDKTKYSKNRTDANFYQLSIQRLKKDIFGIGINYSPVALGNNTSETNIVNFKESSALSFSLFYGKQIVHKEKSTVFFNAGLELNRYSYKFSTKENTNIFSVSVPLNVQYLYQLSSQHTKKPIFLSSELGVFAEHTLPATSKDSLKLYSRFNYGILGGVGLWFTLDNSNLLKFDVSYRGGFNSLLRYFPQGSKYNNGDDKQLPQSTNQSLQNIYFGISWVRTIGGKR